MQMMLMSSCIQENVHAQSSGTASGKDDPQIGRNSRNVFFSKAGGAGGVHITLPIYTKGNTTNTIKSLLLKSSIK